MNKEIVREASLALVSDILDNIETFHSLKEKNPHEDKIFLGLATLGSRAMPKLAKALSKKEESPEFSEQAWNYVQNNSFNCSRVTMSNQSYKTKIEELVIEKFGLKRAKEFFAIYDLMGSFNQVALDELEEEIEKIDGVEFKTLEF